MKQNSGTSSHDLTNHNEGVVHDVNNMLMAICCMADIIKDEIPKSHVCQEQAESIAQVALTCSNLLSTSIQTKTQSLVKKETFNFIDLVQEIIAIVSCKPSLKATIKITHENENTMICGDRSEIGSALMNLYLNAIEAMPDSGLLHINTYREKKSGILNSPEENGTETGECIVIDIKDTGVGIIPENLPHIFEPHFTTKSPLKKNNRGMGLWRVQQCVFKHGGSIHVSSSPGIGTTVTVKLPVLELWKD